MKIPPRPRTPWCLVLLAFAVSSLCAETLKISIFGGVFEPGQYEIPSDQGLIRGIYLSGGVRGDGCPEHVQIRRETDEGAIMIAVNPWEIVFENQADIALQEKDLILVMYHIIGHLSFEEIKRFNERLPIYLENLERRKEQESDTPDPPNSSQ